MSQNGWKLLEMAEIAQPYGKWLKMAGITEMAGNGWKWLEMTGNCWNLLALASLSSF